MPKLQDPSGGPPTNPALVCLKKMQYCLVNVQELVVDLPAASG